MFSLYSLLEEAEHSLLQAWGLVASHSGVWTLEHEQATCHLSDTILRLYSTALHLSTHNKQHGRFTSAMVLQSINSMFAMLLFDIKQRNLMVCCLKMIESLLNLLLDNRDLHKQESRLHLFGGCYMMLKVGSNNH